MRPADARDSLASAVADLGPHEHLCLLYSTAEEQFAAVIPFMRRGLELGMRCIYIADENSVEVVCAALADAGIAVREQMDRGALSVLTKQDSYLRDGAFDPDRMIALLEEAARTAVADGHTGLRVTGEMTWVLAGDPGSERLLEYEAKLNRFFPDHPVSAICQYNRERFAHDILAGVIRTHPLVITGSTVCRNRHYVDPEEFLRPDTADRETDRLLQEILGTERAMQEAEQAAAAWRTTFDALTDHVCLLDRDGVITRCNRSMGLRFGVEPGDLTGHSCYELMHGTSTFVDGCPYRRMLETGVRETLDLHLDGRWYQVSADPLRDELGAIVGAVHVLRDITPSKGAEEALREERRWLIEVNALAVELAAARADDDVGEIVARRLRQATDAVGASFGPYDPAARAIGPMHLDLSPGARRLVPRPVRRRLERVRTPVDDELYATLTSHVIGTPRSLSDATGGALPAALSWRLERAAGVDRFIGLAFTAEKELYGSSLLVLRKGTPDPPTELLETFAHMTGVALRRRRAEKELRASQVRAQFWATVAENAAEAISVGYPDGRLGECNQAYCDLVGYTREELSGTDWAVQLTPPEWLESEQARLAELERGGLPVRYEKEYIRKDGTRVPVELLVHLVDLPGEEPYYIAFVTDISARKQTEAEIRRLNRDLERRVRERTDELTVANRDLQEFVYSVSHDLRTPLRAVDGFSLTVLEDYGDVIGEQGRSDLHRVRAAAQKMGELIDALLTLSRVGRREVTPECVDLSAVARRLVGELREAAPERDVRCTVQDGLTAEADPALLEVVLDNLLQNAWKFTSQRGCAHIEIGAQTLAGERVFYVRDDGAGFDPAYGDKLFQPFQRLHAADEFPGTGIGLATVARVLTRLGGRWWAESVPGRGATFFFTLPDV